MVTTLAPRLAVIGGGLAGCLLAWRMVHDHPHWRVELFRGPGDAAGATDASGGLVRGFETHPITSALAAASLAELRSDSRLRNWSGYQEIGSAYVCAELPGSAVHWLVEQMQRWLPDSARVVDAAGLRGSGLAGLPRSTVGVLETHSGYITPTGLRNGLLGELDARGVVHTEAVHRIGPGPAGTLRCDAASRSRDYDRIVVAAGRWSARLLRASGLADGAFRTKQVQYGIYPATGRMPGTFIDDTTGLYGRRFARRSEVLLGVPSQHWEQDPDRCPATEALQKTTEHLARQRLPELRLGQLRRIVSGADCYHEPPILALRPAPEELPGLYTFTGGSGGAAKYLLAASAVAADQLSDASTGTDRVAPASAASNVAGGAS